MNVRELLEKEINSEHEHGRSRVAALRKEANAMEEACRVRTGKMIRMLNSLPPEIDALPIEAWLKIEEYFREQFAAAQVITANVEKLREIPQDQWARANNCPGQITTIDEFADAAASFSKMARARVGAPEPVPPIPGADHAAVGAQASA
jgi:hypothetical protein